jgi:hypothetical protein
MLRQNPNTRLPTPERAFTLCAGISGNDGQVEIRNPKQIRISNDKMTKTNLLELRYLCHWNILILVIVSYFVLRSSDF